MKIGENRYKLNSKSTKLKLKPSKIWEINKLSGYPWLSSVETVHNSSLKSAGMLSEWISADLMARISDSAWQFSVAWMCWHAVMAGAVDRMPFEQLSTKHSAFCTVEKWPSPLSTNSAVNWTKSLSIFVEFLNKNEKIRWIYWTIFLFWIIFKFVWSLNWFFLQISLIFRQINWFLSSRRVKSMNF